MDKHTRIISRIALLGTLLALFVIGLGAFTRLTDAGLGCPDWPGCYGHLTVPNTASEIQNAHANFPGTTVIAHKAWTEMVHRYLAGTLGLLIFALLAFAVIYKKRDKFMVTIPVLLTVMVLYQAILGMWTVTLQLLPLVVTAHLLGGMLIVSLMWLMYLHSARKPAKNDQFNVFKPWALLGLIVLFAQITLGAWTSTNYAALSCPDFPYCNGQLVPMLDFKDAFNIFSPIGINYEGGVLAATARATIHFSHRFGALLTTLYLAWLGLWMLIRAPEKGARIAAAHVLAILGAQIVLGILNVVMQLPLAIAVLHNIFAAFLLLSVVAVNFYVYSATSTTSNTEALQHG